MCHSLYLIIANKNPPTEPFTNLVHITNSNLVVTMLKKIKECWFLIKSNRVYCITITISSEICFSDKIFLGPAKGSLWLIPSR